jgi:hypothetical protein
VVCATAGGIIPLQENAQHKRERAKVERLEKTSAKRKDLGPIKQFSLKQLPGVLVGYAHNTRLIPNRKYITPSPARHPTIASLPPDMGSFLGF